MPSDFYFFSEVVLGTRPLFVTLSLGQWAVHWSLLFSSWALIHLQVNKRWKEQSPRSHQNKQVVPLTAWGFSAFLINILGLPLLSPSKYFDNNYICKLLIKKKKSTNSVKTRRTRWFHRKWMVPLCTHVTCLCKMYFCVYVPVVEIFNIF